MYVCVHVCVMRMYACVCICMYDCMCVFLYVVCVYVVCVCVCAWVISKLLHLKSAEHCTLKCLLSTWAIRSCLLLKTMKHRGHILIHTHTHTTPTTHAHHTHMHTTRTHHTRTPHSHHTHTPQHISEPKINVLPAPGVSIFNELLF